MLLFPSRGFDPLLLLLAALALDMIVGDLPGAFRFMPHPVALVGRAASWFDNRLNRERRGEQARKVRGLVTVAALVAAAAALGFALAAVLRTVRYGWAIEILLVAILLAQRSLFEHVAAVGQALSQGGIVGGREAVRHIVGRDPQSLDEHGVARAAIESLAENFSDGVVAPALWYALFGLPGMFVYKTVNTLDSMIGHKTPRYLHFGWAAARLDDAANLVPARLAGALIAIAGVLMPRASGWDALRIMLRHARKHRSVNAGWPEAAMAGALDLSLAGPRQYGGELVEDAWIGEGTEEAGSAEIRHALGLFVIACLVEAALIALTALF